MLVKLQLPANDTFRYHAGQYVEFILRDGARRSYSMANAPHNAGCGTPGVELHIRHMPGGKFTDHVFGAMKEKEILRIEGPYGSFYLRDDSAKPMVLLASGTGFAPIKAVIEHMQFKGITRPATLYWGGRRPADLYLDDWVQAQLAVMPNLTYVPVISNALPEDNWTGRTGFVHRPCCRTFRTCRATRSMPAARRLWWTRPAPPTPRWAACRPKSSTPTRSPPKPTNTRRPHEAKLAHCNAATSSFPPRPRWPRPPWRWRRPGPSAWWCPTRRAARST
jgi:NAD(P)H-flavin reductase